MDRQDTTPIQAELPANEYQAFRDLAQEHGLTLTDACHQAVTEWIDRHRRVDPQDPAFTVLNALENEALSASAATDSREESDPVDQWKGSREDWRLAEDPTQNYHPK